MEEYPLSTTPRTSPRTSPAPFVPSVGLRPPPTEVRTAPGPDRLAEFDELYPLVADPTVSDVLALGGRGVWIDDGVALRRLPGMVLPEDRARDLAVRLVALGGRHVDESTPCADVHVGAGIRVHVVLEPIAQGATAISIRLPRTERLGLDELEAAGFFVDVSRTEVEEAVLRRRNVLISGATGSGKTTLLGAMLAVVPADERILTVEDVAELRVDHPHVVALQARQANAEGAGAIGLDRLVREALRMRPDRIVVGECRGAEVRELMSALNTGHDGGAGTVHANGVEDVAARLEALGALAGLDAAGLARQAVSAFDLVFHVARRSGIRRLAAVGTLALTDRDRLTVRPSDRPAVRPARRPAVDDREARGRD